MKQQVFSTAELLIHSKGFATTLEVKNQLFAMNSSDPSFSTNQKEVSDLMTELFHEGKFTRNLQNDGQFQYYKYELANVVTRPTGQTQYVPQSFGLLKESDGTVVCYVSGKPNLYAQGPDRNTARKACFNLYKGQAIVWDNINTCSVKYYNSKLA